jgi:hypothetical protein
MPKMVTFRLDGYDGGLDQQAEPVADGLLQLTDTHWGLTFPEKEVGVSGGLLRSDFAVEAIDRRKSLLRLTTDDGGTCSMVVLARAGRVEKVVALRMAGLARICETVEGVSSGQWWRDPQVFAELGQLRTTSIGGVRYEGGWWRNERVRPTHRRAVLDFAPDGLLLRRWRKKLFLPWALIDNLEIIDGPPGVAARHVVDAPPVPRESGDRPGATIIVRSPSGRVARFSTAIMTPDSVRLRLAPIIQRLEETAAQRPRTTSAT